MIKQSKDRLAAIYCVSISALLLFASFYKTDAEIYLFPRIAAVLIALLTAILLFDALRGESKPASNSPLFNWSSLLPGLGIGIVYVLTLEMVGFYTCSFLAFLLISMVYGKRDFSDWTAFVYKLVVATIFMAILYVLFWNLLHVRTPTGWLF